LGNLIEQRLHGGERLDGQLLLGDGERLRLRDVAMLEEREYPAPGLLVVERLENRSCR
jgi:hypothetical protein